MLQKFRGLKHLSVSICRKCYDRYDKKQSYWSGAHNDYGLHWLFLHRFPCLETARVEILELSSEFLVDSGLEDSKDELERAREWPSMIERKLLGLQG